MEVKEHKFRGQTLIGTKEQVSKYSIAWKKSGCGDVVSDNVMLTGAVFLLSGLPVELSIALADTRSSKFKERMLQLLRDIEEEYKVSSISA